MRNEPLSRQNLFHRIRACLPQDLTAPFIETDGGVLRLQRRRTPLGALRQRSGGARRAPGDRVLVQVDKSPEAIFLYLGCLRAGAVYVPLNVAYTLAEVEYFISDAEPKLVVCRPETAAEVEAVAVRIRLTRWLPRAPTAAGQSGRETRRTAGRI